MCVCVCVQVSPKRAGIIRIGKEDAEGLPYTSNSTARIGQGYSLLLHRVTANDSGTYDCDVSADIGGQNMNLFVTLLVHGEL